MAPVEPSFLSSNAGPLARIATEGGIEIVLLSYIGSQIYKAHNQNLPPALHTRSQHKLHRRGVRVFLALAAVSLALSIYFWAARRVLSYYQWAEHHNEHAPGTLWGGRYEAGKDIWLLDRWLSDTNLSLQRDQTILASSKAWWYAQQQQLGSLAFTAYLGIEGRRRGFGPLYTLAFALLSSQFGLSLAMNLLFVAILLAPETSSSQHPSDSRWAFNNLFQVLSGAAPMAIQLLTPHFPSALTVLGIQRHIVPVLRTAFFLLAPSSALFGRKHASAKEARRSYAPLFSTLAMLSLALYLTQSLVALSDSLPRTSRHWHWDTQRTTQATSFLDRAGHAALRIINVSSHPVIAEITWDIFLTVVTLCTWTAFRGIDVHTLARHSWLPWLNPGGLEKVTKATTSSSNTNKTASGTTGKATKRSGTVRERKKPTVISVEIPTDEESDGYTGQLDVRNIIAMPESPPAGSTRRSIRGQPTPAKATPPAVKPSQPKQSLDEDEEDADTDYVPSKALNREVSQLVPGPEHGTPGNSVPTGEAVAVEWGLFILGGLGAVTAGVLGADT